MKYILKKNRKRKENPRLLWKDSKELWQKIKLIDFSWNTSEIIQKHWHLVLCLRLIAWLRCQDFLCQNLFLWISFRRESRDIAVMQLAWGKEPKCLCFWMLCSRTLGLLLQIRTTLVSNYIICRNHSVHWLSSPDFKNSYQIERNIFYCEKMQTMKKWKNLILTFSCIFCVGEYF